MNEELIYRITQVVYGRLGASANERVVEDLVTDLYRLIDPAVKAEQHGRRDDNDSSVLNDEAGALFERAGGRDKESSPDRLIVTVFGVDVPGIVAGVSRILAEAKCNIVDINQTVVRGKFAMVLIADITETNHSVSELKARFRKQGSELGVRIHAQREDLFNAMHRI